MQNQTQTQTQLSLYIPRVFANITKERIAHVFKSLRIGEVSVIDLVPRKNYKYKNNCIGFLITYRKYNGVVTRLYQ